MPDNYLGEALHVRTYVSTYMKLKPAHWNDWQGTRLRTYIVQYTAVAPSLTVYILVMDGYIVWALQVFE